MPTYLRMRQLATTPTRAGRLPISKATLWRWCATGQFPKPVQLSPGISAWPVEVVEQWERQRAAAPQA